MERVDEVRKDKKLGVFFEASRALKKYVFGDTIDELIDGLELLNDDEFVNEFVQKFPDLTENQLERLDVLMAKTTNAEEIVKYAIKRGKKLSNRNEIEKRLVELEKIFEICEYAAKCKVNDIDAFVELICEKEAPYEIDKISRINGADLLKLKNAMFGIKSITGYNIYQLLEFCSYCQKKSPDIITLDDVKRVEQIVIDYNDVYYSRVCATQIEGTNIERLQEIVVKSKNAEEIFYFARDVKGADIDSLRKAIMKTKDIFYIEKFIKEFGKTSTISKLKRFFK